MYHEKAPHPLLADSVKCFWTKTKAMSGTDSSFEVMPDGFAELVFTFRTDFYLRRNDTLISLPNPFLVGLLEYPIHIQAAGVFTIIGVRMYPWAVLSLIGTRPDENTKHLTAPGLFDVLNDLQALLPAEDGMKLLDCLNDFFLERRTTQGWRDKLLSQAGFVLLQGHGTSSIDSLVNRLSIPVRTLQRLFLRSTGQSPKSLARKIRFQRIRDAIWHEPGIHLTQLAYEYGFSDQAHFNREFRHFSGKTPGEFANEAFNSRKYLKTKSVAFIQ